MTRLILIIGGLAGVAVVGWLIFSLAFDPALK